jgi:hypothetical protein
MAAEPPDIWIIVHREDGRLLFDAEVHRSKAEARGALLAGAEEEVEYVPEEQYQRRLAEVRAEIEDSYRIVRYVVAEGDDG